MEKEKTPQKIIGKQRVLILLLASALFLILVIAFNAQPAYAADHRNPSKTVAPQQIIPDPQENPSNRIQGWIWVYGSNCQPVSGINVYLDAINKTTGEEMAAGPVQTWSNGYFYFENGDPRFMDCIAPNQVCYISINGMRWDYGNGNVWETLGYYCDNPTWSQWRGKVTTDNRGYGCFGPIWLSPASVVNSAAAVLYSDTSYTQSVDYHSGSSHDISFQATVGGNGYATQHSETHGFVWSIYGLHTAQLGKRYYALAYYDGSGSDLPNPGIVKSGFSVPFDPKEFFHTIDVPEYLTPDLSKPNYGLPTESTPISFGIHGGESTSFYYTETGTTTWSYGYTGSVGAHFACFGISININLIAAVTSGHTNAITFTIGPLPVGEPNHEFIVYTRGFSFTEFNSNPFDPSNKGGLELHIWDMGAGT